MFGSNQAAMGSQAFWDSRTLAELTVGEFRTLMQECFDADRASVQRRKNEEFGRTQRVLMGLPPQQQGPEADAAFARQQAGDAACGLYGGTAK